MTVSGLLCCGSPVEKWPPRAVDEPRVLVVSAIDGKAEVMGRWEEVREKSGMVEKIGVAEAVVVPGIRLYSIVCFALSCAGRCMSGNVWPCGLGTTQAQLHGAILQIRLHA